MKKCFHPIKPHSPENNNTNQTQPPTPTPSAHFLCSTAGAATSCFYCDKTCRGLHTCTYHTSLCPHPPSGPSPPSLPLLSVLFCVVALLILLKDNSSVTHQTQTLSTLYIVLLIWLHWSRDHLSFFLHQSFFKPVCNINCMYTLFHDVLHPCQYSGVVHVRHTVYPSDKMWWCYMIRPQWFAMNISLTAGNQDHCLNTK